MFLFLKGSSYFLYLYCDPSNPMWDPLPFWNKMSFSFFVFCFVLFFFLLFSDQPMNISVSMGPSNVVAGSSVNLTCSGAANPAAESYTWYRRTASSRSMLQVGSGQVLSIPSMEASHTGLYSCQARNQLGESNSTEVLLTMREEQRGWCHFTVKNNDLFIWNFKSIIFILYLKWHKCSFSQSNHTVCLSSGSQSLPITAGIGVSLFVTLVLALLLLWWVNEWLRECVWLNDSWRLFYCYSMYILKLHLHVFYLYAVQLFLVVFLRCVRVCHLSFHSVAI